ncbi:MAG: ATP synthase F0 subunit C [Syntrophales bacterium]|jgi:F-type H+-transporting ATPase subunit c|nr:ATP synthase F0 subunit C [Syntrophales bacterium]MDY0043757.1 ATP synthase F0 subunit C [Syntrophales bacterium]
MRKGLKGIIFCLAILGLVMISTSFALAQEEAATTGGSAFPTAIVLGCSLLAAGVAIGFGAIGTGTGMGQATSGAVSAVGRNPDAQGKVLLTMMVGMAMTESIAIYALVISLAVLYANPFVKIIAG